MEQKPSVGRIVHYQMPGEPDDEPSAAVITKVLTDGRCQLFVMSTVGQFQKTCEQSQAPLAGYWNWPPRV